MFDAPWRQPDYPECAAAAHRCFQTLLGFVRDSQAANDGRHIGVLSKESDKRRFKVSASRARDQMWLFHSVTIEDLSNLCLRRQLLEYCLNPKVETKMVE